MPSYGVTHTPLLRKRVQQEGTAYALYVVVGLAVRRRAWTAWDPARGSVVRQLASSGLPRVTSAVGEAIVVTGPSESAVIAARCQSAMWPAASVTYPVTVCLPLLSPVSDHDGQGEEKAGGIGFDPDAPKRPLIVQADPHGARSEAFRTLRTNLQFVDAANHPRSIVFTSSVPAEDKTTTTANLAITMAASDARVCVVEGDLPVGVHGPGRFCRPD